MTMTPPRLGVLGVALVSLVLLSARPAQPQDLTGTWRGAVTVEGQAADFTATFSENGYFLFSYENNQGFVRTVELSAPGQIQFVPPGGGVMTMAVASVVKRPGGVAYVLHTGFERTSGGYLEQQYVTEEADYALTAGGLRVRIVSRAASYFGDRGGSTGGPRNDRIIEGILKKLP
jgi:hypothetical protein